MTTQSSDNPILSTAFAIPFERIKASDVEPAIAAARELAEAALTAIENANPLTYENTFGALDTAAEQLDVAMHVVGHLEAVASTPELRAAYNAVVPGVSAFVASIPLRPALYKVLHDFASTPEAAELPPSKTRFVKKTLDDFRRNGAGLDDAGKARLQQISQELAELTTRFAQNALDSTAEWELVIEDEKALSGLRPSALAAAKQDAEKKGKKGYRFTLQAPSYMAVLMYLDDPAIRERMYRAYNSIASSGRFDNGPIIPKILRLRREQAELLGYRNYADFILEDRMAHDAGRARAFVADLTVRAEKSFARETEELVKFRKSLPGDDGRPMEPWDVAYYHEKQRQHLYDFDAEQLRPYFPLAGVVNGLFETAHRLYGIDIQRNERLPTWHPDVQAYDIKDEDGTFLASFYADFYPREEKQAGAWMNSLRTGVSSRELHTPHLGLICANVTPPIGGKPALLTHQEVTTLFHEFGHLLHHCLSRVDVRSLAGTQVAWDFVELPSQIMENWCWERAALDTFARHFETGEPIPDELFAKMVRARKYREASATMRQLGFSAMDFALHIDFDAERDGDVIAYARKVMQPYAPALLKEDYAMVASFRHLFSGGYAAGYYSYKWAEVLDADAFTRFRQGGVFSRAVGDEFRRAILERGDSDDPAALYRSFMHREPSLDALLERSGLADAAPAVAHPAQA